LILLLPQLCANNLDIRLMFGVIVNKGKMLILHS